MPRTAPMARRREWRAATGDDIAPYRNWTRGVREGEECAATGHEGGVAMRINKNGDNAHVR